MSGMVEAALSPSVGAVVRVWSLSGSSSAETTSRLAMVSFVDEGEGTCDVLYYSKQGGDASSGEEEECGVELHRLAAAEHWEQQQGECTTAQELKERGNALFSRWRDYDAAEQQYQRALKLLSPPAATTGALVMALPSDPSKNLDLRAATVDVEDEGQFEVTFEEEGAGSGGEGVLAPAQIAAVLAPKAGQRELQRVLWLNLARTALKREQHGWAARYASLSLCAAQVLESNKGQGDALAVRARVLLAAHKPHAAKRDAQALAQRGDQARAAAVSKEAQMLLQERKKSTRKLARDIAQWVDVAMQKGGSHAPDLDGLDEEED